MRLDGNVGKGGGGSETKGCFRVSEVFILFQIDINTYHLEETNVHLELFISDITGRNLRIF